MNQAGTGGATVGDVYVVDRGNNRIQQLSASGAFIRAFGLNVGGAGVHVCTVAASCVAGTASAEAGGLSSPQGIAIDQSNGNLYVTDQGNRRVAVYSANGTFQAAFGWGVDTGGAALELCTVASTCAAGASGANAGQFGTQIGHAAVAPAGSPNAGHLYVANKANRRLDQFEPTLTAGEVTGIAFVRGWGWGVDTGAAAFEQCTTASVCQAPNASSPTSNPGQFASNQPQALAVDSNGNVYAVESSGNNRAQKFDSSGNPATFSATELASSPGPLDVAVDPTTNKVYALKEVSGTSEKRIFEFNAAGAFLSTHASGTTITSAGGFAHVQGTGNFYLTSSQGESFTGVFFLGTKVNPTATVQAPSPLTSSSATLKGQVNPTGFSTSYRFEFSADGGTTWTKVPASDVNVGSGEANVPVEQTVNGLVGGHQYRYKIVATKPFGAGAATSSTQTFVTPASAPTVPATFTSAVTTKTAVLNAEINPQNQATTYHFEYGTADCASNPCTSVPIPDAGIGSGETPTSVSREIGDLQAGTTYHFLVVATNGTGTIQGPDTKFHTYHVVALDTSCPNQQFRVGPGARLSDCRGYEMVSPVDKNGGDIDRWACCGTAIGAYFEQAAPSGEKIAYSSNLSFADQVSALGTNQYIATRGPGGWSTEGTNAPRGPTIFGDIFGEAFNFNYEQQSPVHGMSEDLSNLWVIDPNRTPLAPDGAVDFGNLYRRDNLTGSYEALTRQPKPGSTNTKAMDLEFRVASTDGAHQVFDVEAAMTGDAPANSSRKVYYSSGGSLHLVSVLPNGTPAGESAAGGGIYFATGGGGNGRRAEVQGAVSEDGSRVFWTADAAPSNAVFVRENPDEPQSALDGGGNCTEPAKACTIRISGNAVNGQFWGADPEGSKALFTDEPIPGGASLYEFDVATRTPSLIAQGVHGVAGFSKDLSRIYFLSKEVLASGATAGEPNLYLEEGGSKTFIATFTKEEVSKSAETGLWSPGSPGPFFRNTRVTPDGSHIIFMSRSLALAQQVAGYDNTDILSGQPASEVYRYEVDGELICVSCNPSGARPIAHVTPLPHFPLPNRRGGQPYVAAWISGWGHASHAERYISDDGSRVFFNSFDALLPQDGNGVQDVYQWVEQGVGGCPRADGCVTLISTGRSDEESEFVDASADGADLFFRTSESLVPQDPNLVDIYDARISGGYPIPPKPPECVGDACQSPSEKPGDPTPASANFRGAGDPVLKTRRRSCRARKAGGTKLSQKAKRRQAKRCRRAVRRVAR